MYLAKTSSEPFWTPGCALRPSKLFGEAGQVLRRLYIAIGLTIGRKPLHCIEYACLMSCAPHPEIELDRRLVARSEGQSRRDRVQNARLDWDGGIPSVKS